MRYVAIPICLNVLRVLKADLRVSVSFFVDFNGKQYEREKQGRVSFYDVMLEILTRLSPLVAVRMAMDCGRLI